MTSENDLKHVTGPFTGDEYGLRIWAKAKESGDLFHLLDIRGWGHLTGEGHRAMKLSHEEGMEEQRRIQAFVVDALNAAWNTRARPAPEGVEELVERLRKLAQNATPGPWKEDANIDIVGSFATNEIVHRASVDDCERWNHDALYIAACSPENILALLDALARFSADDPDEAYVIGKRDGYENAIQDIDLATGGDGEFKGSTIPGETVDVSVMKERIITRLSARESVVEPFQSRVQPWMMECFGPEISADKLERNDRIIEEALELVQASNYPKERALALVEYVYGRDQGDINQEVGGVMVTLAAHCLAHGVDMHEAGETELARVWTKIDKIRAKQAAKPKGSALPVGPSALKGGG